MKVPDVEKRSIEQLGYKIIGCAMEAQTTLGGCGLLESVYEEALCFELNLNRIHYERQVSLPITYKSTVLTSSLRIDLFVENCIIIECKATLDYNPIFDAQLLTYMRLANVKLGYVINFGEHRLKDGIHRVVNGL